MKITIVSGARPNFMKIAPICRAIQNAGANGKNISYRLVYAGPEDDPSLEESLFFDLGMEKPDAYLGVSGQDYSQIAAAVMLAFEKELDNIQVFVSLENLRREKPFKVIFDIDCTDFDIPVLSLQPYVENAIKYSKVNEKEDGYIRISSSEADGKVLLEISDNGVGFDLGAIRPSSCGIKNSRERFLLLIGTEPEIRSAPGRGTEVIIRLGKNAKEDFQNENDHRR